MKTFTRSAAPLALVAALTLTGCSQGEDATFDQDAQGQEQEQQAQGEQTQDQPAGGSTAGAGTDTTESEDTTDSGDVTADSAAAAGVDPAELGEPIATVTRPAEVEGDPDATMEVSLYSLERDGQALIGIFSFTVSSDATNAEPKWLYRYLRDTSWNPHLIDTVNLTRHDVLSAGGAKLASTDSQGSTYFRPGQTLYAYAAFAPPPADVTTMTVQLVDGTVPVQGVPVR